MNMRWGIVVTLVIAAVLGIYLATLTDGMPVQATDWAMYVMHARNILHGRPYTETGYIVQPETVTLIGANMYPPGFPLMLVPVYAAVGFCVRAFKIVSDTSLALSLWPLYLLSRRFLSNASALVIVLTMAFGFLSVNIHNLISSDGPFQFLSLASIVLMLWIYDRGKDRWPWGVVAGLVFAAAYLTRPVGLALVFAAAATDLIRRRRFSPFLASLLLAFAAIVVLNNAAIHTDSAYKGQFVLSPVIFKHAITYLGYLSYLFASPLGNLFRYLLWVPSMLLALAGMWIRIRRNGVTIMDLYWPLLLGVLCVYWIPNARYLLPVMPVFLIYILVGANAALERIPQTYRPTMQWAAVALLLAAPAANLLRIRTLNQDTMITKPAFDQLCQQIGDRTTVRDDVMFWNPRVLALYTGRFSSPYPLFDPTGIQGFIDRVQPQYVVFDKDWEGDRRYLAPVLDLQPQRYVTLYENDQFRLAQVRP